MNIEKIEKVVAIGIGEFNPQGFDAALFKAHINGQLASNLRELAIDDGLVIPYTDSAARAEIARLVTSAVAVIRRKEPHFTIKQFTNNLEMKLTIIRTK